MGQMRFCPRDLSLADAAAPQPQYELASSPCSTSDHDRRLVETISEDDRATLLPIIRIAFPSFKHSMQDPFTSWYFTADDRNMGTGAAIKEDPELEESHYPSMEIGSCKQENRAALQYDFIPTVPSTIAETHYSADVDGLHSQHEFTQWPIDEVANGAANVVKSESVSKADELISRPKSEPEASILTDARLSLSISSGCGLMGATDDSDRIVAGDSQNVLVQGQATPLVEDSSEFNRKGLCGSGPSSTDSGGLTLKGTQATDQPDAGQPLKHSQAYGCDESEREFSSEPEEGASFGRNFELACASDNKSQSLLVTESQGVSAVVASKVDRRNRPEVNRKRRNVIKKAVGWVRKRRTTQPSSARVAHKRKCDSDSCTGCELGSKRRRVSAGNSCEVTPSTHCTSLPKVQSFSAAIEKWKEEVKGDRNSAIDATLSTHFSAMNTSPDKKESSSSVYEWANSPLSTALFVVLLETGSHGVTVCEALRKLLKQGYSKLFSLNSEPRAVQVKMALRRCPDFKELKSRRFVLRDCGRAVGKKQMFKTAPLKQSRKSAEDHGHEKGFSKKDLCHIPQTVEGCSEQLTGNSVADKCRSFGQEQQCHKTDGKQWRCSQQVKPGLLYCEHHYQCRTKARMKGHSAVEGFHSIIEVQKLQISMEEGSQTVADSCSGPSREHSQGEEPKIGRCRRTDGRHWQCSKQAKSGSIYCEHHQGRRKKVKAKGSGSGRITASREGKPERITEAREAKQKLHIPDVWAIDSADNDANRKAKGNMHQQCIALRQLKQLFPRYEACTVEAPQIVWKGNVHSQIPVYCQETVQGTHISEVCVLDRPQSSIGHGQAALGLQGKKELAGFRLGSVMSHMAAPPYKWEGKTNCSGQADIDQVLQAAIDVSSQCARDPVTRMLPSNQQGQTGKINTKKALRAVEALSSERSSAAVNSCCPAEKYADVRGSDKQLERCHRRDGKRWQCSQQCKLGYIYCEHHLGRRHKGRAVASGQTKPAIKKELQKWVSSSSHGGSLKDCTVKYEDLQSGEQSRNELLHVTDDCSQSATAAFSEHRETELQNVKRCHRSDGKGWQCSHQAKQGFNYCEHHQVYLSRRTVPKVSKKQTGKCTSSDSGKSWSDMLTMGCGSAKDVALTVR